jgi:hypothetical protein
MGGFIIFETEKSRDLALYAMNNIGKYKCCNKHQKYPKRFLFKAKHKLKVKAADEPSNIFWENFDIPLYQKYARLIFVVGGTLFFNVLSYFFCYLVMHPGDDESTTVIDNICFGLAITATNFGIEFMLKVSHPIIKVKD